MPKRRRSSSTSGSRNTRPRRNKFGGRRRLSKYWLPPKRRTTFGEEVKTLYHITAFGKEIRKSGEMLRGSDGAVGGGIYFASSEAKCEPKAESGGWLVKANVFVGNSLEVDTNDLDNYSFTKLQREGYDSIKLRGFSSGTEYVVFNKDQVELLSVKEMCVSSDSS